MYNLALKNLERVEKNGTRLVQILTCLQENDIFQWKQGDYLIYCKKNLELLSFLFLADLL
jgi:hypothetical protein